MNQDKKPLTADLVEALRTDKEFYETWKANIAMQFQDHFGRDFLRKGVYEISNEAADSFLRLLTRKS